MTTPSNGEAIVFTMLVLFNACLWTEIGCNMYYSRKRALATL